MILIPHSHLPLHVPDLFPSLSSSKSNELLKGKMWCLGLGEACKLVEFMSGLMCMCVMPMSGFCDFCAFCHGASSTSSLSKCINDIGLLKRACIIWVRVVMFQIRFGIRSSSWQVPSLYFFGVQTELLVSTFCLRMHLWEAAHLW